MKVKRIKWMVSLFTVALALAALPLFAQEQTSPGVARVSVMQGDVSMKRGDSGEWMAVTLNTPLLPGDSIATGAGARVEVQLDYSNVLRLAQNSEAKIADLSRSRIQLQVARGTADLAVFQGNQASSEVDTPNVAVQPLRDGTYRIDVNSASLSLVTVRRGQAQISTPQGSTTINEGQQITVEGAQNPQYQVVSARPLDSWDNWNTDRNRVFENAQNYNHVNRYYTGAQDLDTYGHWVYVPNYDWCWTPYINAGWVPYSNGRWVWEPYYGWTWVSYEPWGWAPYHYGRWFFYGSSWFWWPGAVTPYYYPVWGPAWVSFIGFGYGYYHFSFGFGYGFRSIGWCPLGPRDRYHPWWGRGHSFNVVNYHDHYGRGFDGGEHGGRGYSGSNMEAAFSNDHIRRAITTIPADRFGREAVGRNRQVVSDAMLRRADVVHGTLPVVPTRESLRVTNRAAVVPAVARSGANNDHFFSRRPATQFNSEHSFNNQAASIRRMVETRNVRAMEANRGNAGAMGNRGYEFSRPAGAQQRTGQGSQQGWRRFGPTTQAENARGQEQRSFGMQSRGNAGRQNPAPIVREAPRSNQQNERGFGNPGVQSRGNAGRQGPAPVVREAPQGRQNVSPGTGRAPQSNPSSWRRFSGKSPASSQQAPGRGSQRYSPGAGRSQQNGGNNFRRFTPQSAPQAAPQNQGRFYNNSRAAPQQNNGGSAGWNRFRPQEQAPQQQRGGGFYNGGAGGRQNYQPRYQYQRQPNYGQQYSRPPLRLNKPIVTERRQPSYSAPRGRSESGYRGGGYRGSPQRPSGGSRGGGHRR